MGYLAGAAADFAIFGFVCLCLLSALCGVPVRCLRWYLFVPGVGVKMETIQPALDARKQELLEARFIGARVSVKTLFHSWKILPVSGCELRPLRTRSQLVRSLGQLRVE